MGVVFGLIRVRPEDVAVLRDRPEAVEAFMNGDLAIPQPGGGGFLSRLFGGKPPEGDAHVPARRNDDEIDLDKSWHVIHYLLTGSIERTDSPLSLIADNRDPLADIDLGMGKPSVIAPADVKAFAAAVASLTDDDFLARFDAQKMPSRELYMGDVAAEANDEFKEYVLEYFHELRDFARTAADAGDALLTSYG